MRFAVFTLHNLSQAELSRKESDLYQRGHQPPTPWKNFPFERGVGDSM